MEEISTAFRLSVTSLADTNHIPVDRFHKGDRKSTSWVAT
jgi:antitoxin component of RelBE/YafQ-DinJ toxin-antitoxin module